MARREFGREERVGAELHRELALILRDEVRDPRLNQVTVQEVRVTRDLAHAKVYFTVLDRNQVRKTEQALNKAAGFLRKQLGGRVILRTIPALHFVYDHSLERGMRLSSLIEQAVASSSDRDADGPEDNEED
ncbi:30S ribosome-binding factor RbfA [endosymbiont of unidentified scaly snail isolate Monju]|uniref:30S ribosome-binding factor RbfA n=1 Tax=endosymbiont of unidentified scaly snail isolate Monju TaxID=1248727 RepID=UPI0003892B9E|nr:30S ribosome-binding factor RbfA [endosymbiont of unidentified scaly snail isolate Monju]BAN69373.1 ribosome-binding factor A [endosymbiont of unidentified scaly snail isolate Monju]